MDKFTIDKGSVDVTLLVHLKHATTGQGLTGLAFNTASLVASYARPGAARAAIALATQTVAGIHADGGFVEIDATNMPGLYRLDLPDAVVATGVNSAKVMLKGAANLLDKDIAIELVDVINAANPVYARVDALDTTARTEPSAGAPGVSIVPLLKIDHLYAWLRNKKTVNEQTGMIQVYADNGTTVLYELPYADSANVLTVSEAQANT